MGTCKKSKQVVGKCEELEISHLALLKFCNLSTLIVSDESIRRGIISAKNVQQVLFLFMRAGKEPTIADWIMPHNRPLVEGRWLQLLNWVMEQDLFIETKKCRFAALLIEKQALTQCASVHSVQSIMAKPLPPDIDKAMFNVYKAQ